MFFKQTLEKPVGAIKDVNTMSLNMVQMYLQSITH
jgi:hypothetical protein